MGKNNFYDEANVFNKDDLDTLQDNSSLAEVDFQARLDIVPEDPGVYMMKDTQGKIIYVGKAKNLRKRLSSYFQKNVKGSSKVQAMLDRIADFSYLTCKTELEALVLESNLIKRYQPFYNILLKDDRDYPYMRISMNELYPRVEKAYRVGSDKDKGCKYYGPYLNADLKAALKSIHELFPLKTCSRVFPRDIGKERPCIQYYIGRCIGPCLGTVPAEAYREVCANVCSFLEGRYDDLLKDIKTQMLDEAERLDFQAAARSRDRLKSLERLFERQQVVSSNDEDADILAIEENDIEAIILKLELRSGKISGTSSYFFTLSGADLEKREESFIEAFVTQYYPNASFIPEKIIIDMELPSKELLTKYLQKLKGRKVELHRPKRGYRKDLLEMAKRNARQTLERRSFMPSKKISETKENLDLLLKCLNLSNYPNRIEAYDIANLGDEAQVCAMTVFENGKVNRRLGRAFYIKRQDYQDDYAAMYEAIDRRLNHLGDEENKFGAKPDLILLDGGIGHLNTIKKLFEERQILDIDLAAMVKDKRHRTRGLVNIQGEIIELSELAGIRPSHNRRSSRSEEGLSKETHSKGEELESEINSIIKNILATRENKSETDLFLNNGSLSVCEEEDKKIYKDVATDNKSESNINSEELVSTNMFEHELGLDEVEESEDEILRISHDLTDQKAMEIRTRREKALKLLRFITAIQNEVHRQAGEHHRKLKNKKMLSFRLEEIKGIGEGRRKLLMKEFGTIKSISEASPEEINRRCSQISLKQAELIYEYFHRRK